MPFNPIKLSINKYANCKNLARIIVIYKNIYFYYCKIAHFKWMIVLSMNDISNCAEFNSCGQNVIL